MPNFIKLFTCNLKSDFHLNSLYSDHSYKSLKGNDLENVICQSGGKILYRFSSSTYFEAHIL